jgi:putative peptidoglycan lipid II flippase
VRYGLAQTLYLLPWAVLALPVATSAYPALAAAAAGGDHDTYRRTLAAATRGALLVSALGAAALAALAPALAALLAFVTDGGDPAALATAVAWFAPGLPGYALFALLSRALYARGDAWLAATATAAGWGAVALASLAFAATVPDSDRVAALAAANSVGMLVLGGCLLAAVARRAGVGALAGTVRAAVAALAAAGAAAAAGTTVWHLCVTSATPGAAATLTPGMLSGVTVAAVFTATAYLLDRRDVHPVLAGASARARRLARR